MNVTASHIGAEDECVKVFDPSKQELLKVFNTYGEASRYLGLTSKVLRNAALNKTRRFSPFLNKEIAVRLGLKK